MSHQTSSLSRHLLDNKIEDITIFKLTFIFYHINKKNLIIFN